MLTKNLTPLGGFFWWTYLNSYNIFYTNKYTECHIQINIRRIISIIFPKQVYRVNGLKGNPQKEKFFDDQNQREVTVYDYFVKQKNIRLNYPSLPCLWVGSRERKSPLLLPLELCTILGGQAVNRKMNEIQTSNMIKRAATDTATRKGKIFDSLRNAK